MVNAFNAMNENSQEAIFVSVMARKKFISAGSRPPVLSLLNEKWSKRIFKKNVGTEFELGTMEYRASVYHKLILSADLDEHAPIVPSDDEACWMAAAACSAKHPMVAILHADEEVYFQLVNRYKKFISVYICVSKRILNSLLQRHPEVNGKSLALPCGIPVEDFYSGIKDNTIAWIGRLSMYQKRAEDIIPIFRKVISEFADVKLNVFGDGEYSSDFNSHIVELKLENSIYNHGWIGAAEIRAALGKSKVFLQTSEFEGTSVAMMEALASGCVVISTRVSGIEDLEHLPESDGAIYLYEIGNTEQAAELIKSVLIHTEDWSGQKPKLLGSLYFDINKNNSHLIDFINKVVHINHSSIGSKKNDAYRFGYWHVPASLILSSVRWVKWKIKNVVLKNYRMT